MAVGADVHALQPGDRVATFGPQRNAYASARLVPASSLFRLPPGIDDETAAAALLKACTVEAPVERSAKVEAGTTILVHAAARSEDQPSEHPSLMHTSSAVVHTTNKHLTNNTHL